LVGWAIAALAAGVAFGSVARNIGSMLGSGGQVRAAIVRLGGQHAITDAYLAAMLGILGLAAAGCAISVVLRLRGEESAERAEAVLASATGRFGWSASYLGPAVVGAAAVVVAGGLGAGLGLQAGGAGSRLWEVLGAALAQLPAALAVAAVAVALFGLAPRACVAGGWTALALAALVMLFGPTLRLAPWVQDISPFTHVPRLGSTVTAAPIAWLCAAALVLAAAGLVGLRRRDIG
jgi:ABC-2 type transport system permease protein